MTILAAKRALAKALLVLTPALLAGAASGCNDAAVDNAAGAGSGASAEPVSGLSAEQASKVVAKVGDRAITLGDFARTLERMDPFDRLRYQTKERRRELLAEMIDVELLAQEAKKRGLDHRPEVEDAIRQLYRDALLQKMRDSLPPPAGIPADEVRAYYEANADKYNEPERRRVSSIVVASKADADKVLALAKKVKTAAEWGELFQKSSLNAPKTKGANDPADLAGDLGIVGPPNDPKGGNSKVPEAVRAAVFKLTAVGQVADEIVEADGKFFVVRMSGLTQGHKRSLQEADRSIRVAILQQRMQDMEKQLDQDLRKKFPVEINDKVIGEIKLPAAMVDAATAPSPWSKKQDEAGDAAPGGSAAPGASGAPAPGDAPPGNEPAPGGPDRDGRP